MMTCARVELSILVFLTVMAAGCQGPGQGKRTIEAAPAGATSSNSPAGGKAQASASASVVPAHFQATIYEVEAAAERLRGIDGRTLSQQAATAEALLGALSELGTARILYRFDQPVNVFGETLRIGTREPIVTGTRSTPGGGTVNSFRYQEIGAIIKLSARMPPKAPGRKGPDVTVAAEVAALAGTSAEFAPGKKLTAVRSLSLEHEEELEYGRPRVMLAVSSTASDQKEPPAMYVIRYVFNRDR